VRPATRAKHPSFQQGGRREVVGLPDRDRDREGFSFFRTPATLAGAALGRRQAPRARRQPGAPPGGLAAPLDSTKREIPHMPHATAGRALEDPVVFTICKRVLLYMGASGEGEAWARRGPTSGN
jgi:hypothetical protein